MDYLLDTVIVIRYYQKREQAIAQRLAQVGSIFLSTVTLGELYHGAFRSQQTQRNLARIAVLRQTFPVLVCDPDTALVYGEIEAHLRTIGKPIPTNNMWLAALARQHGLTLATSDAHFDNIPQLMRERW